MRDDLEAEALRRKEVRLPAASETSALTTTLLDHLVGCLVKPLSAGCIRNISADYDTRRSSGWLSREALCLPAASGTSALTMTLVDHLAGCLVKRLSAGCIRNSSADYDTPVHLLGCLVKPFVCPS
jgi:hypothetical protein